MTPHTVTYTLGPLNRQSVTDAGVVTTYGTASGMNQYPTVGGLPLTYDTNFNLASYNGWSYVFDAAGQLTSARASGHTASFVYDGLGCCVQHNRRSRYYHYLRWLETDL